MVYNDSTIDDNYQRLLAKTLQNVYSKAYDNETVEILRDEIIGKIREPLKRLFPDLLLLEVKSVTENADFIFEKGTTPRYGYGLLSGGEKTAFDLLLDLVIKYEFYRDTVFCIDEPEAHMHAKLQASLLSELFGLINDDSQPWIATHSFGMLKEAGELDQLHPGEIAFLNFDGYDFDEAAQITPERCDSVIWNKMMEISFNDYAQLVLPETIVFCEGATTGRTRKDFDARCYENVFSSEMPGVLFYSFGNCIEIVERKQLVDFVNRLAPGVRVIKPIDEDDMSEEDVNDKEREDPSLRVLRRHNIESYLLDDEVLRKLCETYKKPELAEDVLGIKKRHLPQTLEGGTQAMI